MRPTIRTFIFMHTIAVMVAYMAAVPTENSADSQSYRTCRDLCSSCGCLGFYCGDECLCECDGTGEQEDNKCVEEIHNRCERMQLPFEVLIQGSDGNRLVRSLRTYSSAVGQTGNCNSEDHHPAQRAKRSTYSIYKPSDNASRRLTDGNSLPSPSTRNKMDGLWNSDSVDTLRLVQSFLSEIGAELNNEIQEKDTERETDGDLAPNVHSEQQNYNSAMQKRDVDSDDVSVLGAADRPAVASAPLSASANGNINVSSTPVLWLPMREQQLTSELEKLKARLLLADSQQLDAMRAYKQQVKTQMLADLEESRQAWSQTANDTKQKFADAQHRTNEKAAELRHQLAQIEEQQIRLPIRQLPSTTTTIAPPVSDENVGAIGPPLGIGSLPMNFGNAFQPALDSLRGILKPVDSAPPLPLPTPSQTSLLQVPNSVRNIGASERALLQQIKAKAYLDGLSATSSLRKRTLRNKLLAAAPGSKLGAWARSLYAGGNLLGNTVDDNVGASQNQQQCDDSTTSDAYSPNTPTTAADGRYHTTTAAFVGGNDKQTADAAFALET